jgi:hypothetical protein
VVASVWPESHQIVTLLKCIHLSSSESGCDSTIRDIVKTKYVVKMDLSTKRHAQKSRVFLNLILEFANYFTYTDEDQNFIKNLLRISFLLT